MDVKKSTNTLFWLPLEILDKRYTKQTRKWYDEEFKKHFNVKLVEGKELTSEIESGSFLDSYGTNYYKYTQLANVAKLFRDGEVKDGDIFFIDDLWMPGIEGIRYMEKMGKELNVKIYGVMHAGSWIPSDDVATKLGNKSWCKKYEESILDLTDKIFVGSEFHKQEMLKCFSKHYEDKIINTGLPFYPSEIQRDIKKENIILFPHRIHPEKHPELFDKLKCIIGQAHNNWKFIKTMDLDLNKEEYLDLLAKSKIVVSFADQENFGFSILEAASLGCHLVLPNRVVYPEFYPKECLFDTFDECLELVKNKMFDDSLFNDKPYKFEKSIERMCDLMKC